MADEKKVVIYPEPVVGSSKVGKERSVELSHWDKVPLQAPIEKPKAPAKKP